MKADCRDFRSALELRLEGRVVPGRLTPLSWHEHLLACADCRTLLESEEVLEELLASLPDPHLPDDLARRLVDRLRRERLDAAGLDALLDASPEPEVPAGLAGRVLAGLAAHRNASAESAGARAAPGDPLDRLLESWPAPAAPPTLTADVLARVRASRRRSEPAVRPDRPARPERLLRRALSFRQVATWTAVAAALVAAVLWMAGGESRRGEAPGRGLVEGPPAGRDELTEELVAAFDVLANWDYLHSDDVDLLLASIDELDALVFEESAWEEVLDDDAGDGTDRKGG